jgi:DNA-binding response OmpR family regulator
LVVEDEPLVAMMAVEALSDAGFAAEEAATSAEAVAKIRGELSGFDAVILDMGLPDRPGDEVARELRTMRSDLPIVIASGYDRVPLQKLFAHDPRIVVVAKPYISNDLRAALAALGVHGQGAEAAERPSA